MPTLSDRALAVARRVARKAGRLLHSRERDRREISFKGGKGNAINALKGQVMKATRGQANPKLVDEILRKLLAS